ncbi:unnamed protein product [Rhizophagus irregularis]|nr:unnamed protein product [Rhizophagus irregularis]
MLLVIIRVVPHLIPSRFISVSGFESLFWFGFLFLGRWIYRIGFSFRFLGVGYMGGFQILGLWIGIVLGLWIGFHFKLILNRSGFHFGFWFPLRFLLNKWFSFGLYLMSRLILKLFG